MTNKKAFRNIFFIFLAVIIVLIGAELSYRIFFSLIKKNPVFLFYGKYFFQSKWKKIVADNVDFENGEENQPEYLEKNQKAIWIFGGSTTVCREFKQTNERWSNRLDYYLGDSVIIENLAVNGATLAYNLSSYKNYIIERGTNPDVVIFHMGINDAMTIAGLVRDEGHIIKLTPMGRISCLLMDTSLAYAHLKMFYHRLFKKNIDPAWKIQRFHIPTIPGILHFKQDLASLINVCKDFDSLLVLSAVPISQKFLEKSPDSVENIFNTLIDIMRNAAEEEGVYFLNCHESIFKTYRDFDKCFTDGVHYNKKGNELLGRYLTDYIIRNQII